MNDDLSTRTDATIGADPAMRGSSYERTAAGTTMRDTAQAPTDERDRERAEHQREHDEKHREHEAKKRRDSEPEPAIAAVFGSAEEARQAVSALHKAHFKKTWYGVTSLASNSHGGETITAESGGTGGFFSETSSLVDALVAHGLLGDVARRIESRIEPGDAIVTVRTGDDDPNDALEVLSRFGGDVETSALETTATSRSTTIRTERMPTMRGDVDDRSTVDTMPQEETFYARRR